MHHGVFGFRFWLHVTVPVGPEQIPLLLQVVRFSRLDWDSSGDAVVLPQ
jgi:hypothetical protein